jgi:pimeloyl-ACP methyl ester carboxylesterase
MATKPVIVLVPGLFHKPSSWAKVAGPLRDHGYTVLTPPLAVGGDLTGKTPASLEWKELASKSFVDDRQVILDAVMPLLDEGKTAILVGHSFGSVPATLAVEGQTVAERQERGLKGGVVALVVIAGFAYPVKGKSVFGDENEPPLMPYHVLEVSGTHSEPHNPTLQG